MSLQRAQPQPAAAGGNPTLHCQVYYIWRTGATPSAAGMRHSFRQKALALGGVVAALALSCLCLLTAPLDAPVAVTLAARHDAPDFFELNAQLDLRQRDIDEARAQLLAAVVQERGRGGSESMRAAAEGATVTAQQLYEESDAAPSGAMLRHSWHAFTTLPPSHRPGLGLAASPGDLDARISRLRQHPDAASMPPQLLETDRVRNAEEEAEQEDADEADARRSRRKQGARQMKLAMAGVGTMAGSGTLAGGAAMADQARQAGAGTMAGDGLASNERLLADDSILANDRLLSGDRLLSDGRGRTFKTAGEPTRFSSLAACPCFQSNEFGNYNLGHKIRDSLPDWRSFRAEEVSPPCQPCVLSNAQIRAGIPALSLSNDEIRASLCPMLTNEEARTGILTHQRAVETGVLSNRIPTNDDLRAGVSNDDVQWGVRVCAEACPCSQAEKSSQRLTLLAPTASASASAGGRGGGLAHARDGSGSRSRSERSGPRAPTSVWVDEFVQAWRPWRKCREAEGPEAAAVCRVMRTMGERGDDGMGGGEKYVFQPVPAQSLREVAAGMSAQQVCTATSASIVGRRQSCVHLSQTVCESDRGRPCRRVPPR